MKKGSILKDLKEILKYITSILMYAVIIILVIIGIILLIYFIDLKNKGRNPEWKAPLYGAYVIMSGSMDPTIKVYDAIIIKRMDSTNIKTGDVITYKSEDQYFYGLMITHRVIDIKEENGETVYITKGDNNATNDRLPVKYSQIYGKTIMRIPKIGYVQWFLSQAYGWILAVVLPCLAIVTYDILKLIKRIKLSERIAKRRGDRA